MTILSLVHWCSLSLKHWQMTWRAASKGIRKLSDNLVSSRWKLIEQYETQCPNHKTAIKCHFLSSFDPLKRLLWKTWRSCNPLPQEAEIHLLGAWMTVELMLSVYSIRLLRKDKLMLTSPVQVFMTKGLSWASLKLELLHFKRLSHASHFKLAAPETYSVSDLFRKLAVFHILFCCKTKRNGLDYFFPWNGAFSISTQEKAPAEVWGYAQHQEIILRWLNFHMPCLWWEESRTENLQDCEPYMLFFTSWKLHWNVHKEGG